jgi:hypothetical protein
MTSHKSSLYAPWPFDGLAAFTDARIAALIGKLLLPMVILTPVCLFAMGAAPLPRADAQGWSGSGWYLTSQTPRSAPHPDSANYILFQGPYNFQAACLDVQDRLYSPAGACRFLSIKPQAYKG